MKKFIAFVLSITFILTSLPAISVSASSSMTVNCGRVIRPVTHCASGSLYGITESKPNDIDNLVTPLKPDVFTNPARSGSGYQQPHGAAIPSAGRITGTGGKVMIRLADICPKWPYTFPGMSNWLSSVRSVISDKLASGYNNYYGYEIWNEPVYTWNNANGTFENLWSQTYSTIKKYDSSAKIIGPSEGYYNHNKMKNFLTYCIKNNCLPDIISWHELTDIQNLSNNLKDYRALEASLGISERPISINEYCDRDHRKEGCPGAMSRFIAKFERAKVDSACISWWWTAHPGRLGSLLATDTQKGAGWWFYKWYADMTGNMVSVTPPNDASDLVDGFACVDKNEKYVSCLFGGNNDGTVNITFSNLPSFIGSSATVLVQKVDWVNKDTVSSGPLTVSTQNYTLSGRHITVSVTGCNNTSGYRILVLPAINNSQTRYEAENALVTESNLFSNSVCSNGRYVGQIDHNDSFMPRYSYVDFIVNAPTSKTYTMAIKYANGTGTTSTQGLAYNSGGWSTISYPSTGGWFSAGNNGGTVTTNISLKKGINVIRLAKGSPYFDGGKGYAELDYIEIK